MKLTIRRGRSGFFRMRSSHWNQYDIDDEERYVGSAMSWGTLFLVLETVMMEERDDYLCLAPDGCVGWVFPGLLEELP